VQLPSEIALTFPDDLLAQKSMARVSSALTGVIDRTKQATRVPIAEISILALITIEPTCTPEQSRSTDRVLM
jgi:hypothetical protein